MLPLAILGVLACACYPSLAQKDRYLLYTVNPGEGFNLARDVFLRVVALMDKLKAESSDNWTLVCFKPPNSPLAPFAFFSCIFLTLLCISKPGFI